MHRLTVLTLALLPLLALAATTTTTAAPATTTTAAPATTTTAAPATTTTAAPATTTTTGAVGTTTTGAAGTTTTGAAGTTTTGAAGTTTGATGTSAAATTAANSCQSTSLPATSITGPCAVVPNLAARYCDVAQNNNTVNAITAQVNAVTAAQITNAEAACTKFNGTAQQNNTWAGAVCSQTAFQCQSGGCSAAPSIPFCCSFIIQSINALCTSVNVNAISAGSTFPDVSGLIGFGSFTATNVTTCANSNCFPLPHTTIPGGTPGAASSLAVSVASVVVLAFSALATLL